MPLPPSEPPPPFWVRARAYIEWTYIRCRHTETSTTRRAVSPRRGEATTHEVAPNLWHIRVDGAYDDWAFTGWCARWKARRLSR